MAVKNLTQGFVNKVNCGQGKDKERFHDSKCKGLMLEIRPTGTKTFFVKYKDQRGRYKQMKLGRAGDISVSQARELGHRILGNVAMGKDPGEEKRNLQAVPRFDEFVSDRFLPHIKSYKKSWKLDEGMLRNHILPEFGSLYLDEITAEMVTEFHNQKKATGLAPASVNRLLILIKFIFNLAIKWQTPGLKDNPTQNIKKFEENNMRDRYLTLAELSALDNALKVSKSKVLEPIVLLLVLTGARKREVMDAKWEDFDLERKTWRISITKTGKPRTVPLSDKALQVLGGIKKVEGSPYVFANPKTKKPYNCVYYGWDMARKRAGLEDICMHTLRHSFASFLINGGRSIYEVGKLLGHSQISTTMRYAHLSEQTLAEAVNV
ncbi:site-specific integrase, partial [Desulfonatronovibrio magnus]|uniref:site-specific integrase n=1 Tax=Desulfonatronovibrio magnus TaxID=698827 RepID=UPI0005EB3203